MQRHSPIAFQLKRHLTLSLYLLPLIYYWEYSPQARRGSEETYTKQNFAGGSLAFSPHWSPADVLTHCPSTQRGLLCSLHSLPRSTVFAVAGTPVPSTRAPHLPSPPTRYFPLRPRHLSGDYKEAETLLLESAYDSWSPNHHSAVPRLKDCPLFLEGKRGRIGLLQPLLPGSINTFQWGHFSFNSSFTALSLLCLNKIYHLTIGM